MQASLLEPIKSLVRLLTLFRKSIEKRLTRETVNNLTNLIVHAIVIFTAEAFIILLLLYFETYHQ